jgi:hypothetical protein
MDYRPCTRTLATLGFLYSQKQEAQEFQIQLSSYQKNTASANRASTALKEPTEALKNPAAAKPFLNTGNKLNAAIEALFNRNIIQSLYQSIKK